MPTIISASRRTDIPAFFAEWLVGRLAAAYCDWWHPFARHWLRVSLSPADVAGIVLWTRNIAPLLPHLPAIRRQYLFYVHYTITGYPRELEPGVIAREAAVRQVKELAGTYGPETVIWRFDPIVLTQEIGPADTVARFAALAAELEGATERCIISFMSPYRRQARAFRQAGLVAATPSPELRLDLAQQIGTLARRHGMAVSACCNADILSDVVERAHCVDADLLRRLGASLPARVPAAPSRKQCGCAQSVDIGAYDLCGGGCVYCYANQDHALADRNRLRHRVEHVGLAEAFLTRDPPPVA